MKSLRILKTWLIDGCIYFTVIALLLLVISAILGNDADGTSIRVSSFLLILPCGLLISVGTQILRNDRLSRAARYFAHYLLTVLAIFLFLWLPSNSLATPMAGFLMLLLFTVLYWIVFIIVQLIRKRIKRQG